MAVWAEVYGGQRVVEADNKAPGRWRASINVGKSARRLINRVNEVSVEYSTDWPLRYP